MDPTAKPTAIGPPFKGQIKIITELPPGLDKSKDEPKENGIAHESVTPTPSSKVPSPVPASTKVVAQQSTTIKSETKSSSLSEPTLDLNLDLRVNIFEAAAKAYKEKKNLKQCGVCQKDVKEGYEKDAQQFVCTSCYESDKLLENTSKDDYTKTVSNETEKEQEEKEEKPWTEQEELLLLEGLEMFPSDWDDIAKHVATRTRDACILHYLKLPTADPRIDEEVKKLGLLRFNQKDSVSNPVMSVVAFLAANVKPQVAASSIDQYEEESNEGIATAMESTSDSLDVFYDLIHSKIAQFTSRLEDFEQMESAVDEQRRQLEREKFLIREDHLSIRNRMDAIYHIMFQRRQAKLLKEQQQRMLAEQQREEPMPLDIVIKLPTEPMTQEERSFQEGLRAKYPTQYIKRQHELAASRQASLPLAPPSIPS